MSRGFSIERRRWLRIDAAKREALHSGLRISGDLRTILNKGEPLLVAVAIGRALNAGVVLPRAIGAHYAMVQRDPTTEALAEFARDVRDMLVNVPTIEAASHV